MESPKVSSKSQHGSSGSQSSGNKNTARGGGGGGNAATGGEFIVAKILGKRIIKNEAQYHVKWEGYTMAEATWEPYGNLTFNVVRTKFDEKLKNWLRKHDESGGSAHNRVSDVDREIAEWTAKQPASVKVKYAKNNEELRADRVEQEIKELSQVVKSQRQQSAEINTTVQTNAESATTTPAKITTSGGGSNAATVPTDAMATPKIASTNGGATPTPTGLATPVAGTTNATSAAAAVTPMDTNGSSTPSGGAVKSGGGSQFRRKRTSPYPEWVAVARKRLLTEKRNVLKIYSLSSINDVPCYKVQLDGLREPEYIPTVLVKSHHPNRVIEFYEDHLTVPSPSKDGKRIKLKDLFAEMQQQQQIQQQASADGSTTTAAGAADGSNGGRVPSTNQSTNNELAAYGEADHHHHHQHNVAAAGGDHAKTAAGTGSSTPAALPKAAAVSAGDAGDK